MVFAFLRHLRRFVLLAGAASTWRTLHNRLREARVARHRRRESLEAQKRGERLLLSRGAAIRFCGERGTLVYVVRGLLWLTQTQDARDIVLGPGERFFLDRTGLVLAEAREGAEVCVGAPMAGFARLDARATWTAGTA